MSVLHYGQCNHSQYNSNNLAWFFHFVSFYSKLAIIVVSMMCKAIHHDVATNNHAHFCRNDLSIIFFMSSFIQMQTTKDTMLNVWLLCMSQCNQTWINDHAWLFNTAIDNKSFNAINHHNAKTIFFYGYSFFAFNVQKQKLPCLFKSNAFFKAIIHDFAAKVFHGSTKNFALLVVRIWNWA